MDREIRAEDLKVNLLAISGSGRHANTDLALKITLDKSKEERPDWVGETEFVSLADLNLVPCTGCMKCWGWRAPADDEEFECYESHDDSAMVIKKMKWADGIIIGTPNYNGGVSSRLKIIMEKCHCFGHLSYTRNAGKLMYKPLAVQVVGMTDWSGHGMVRLEVIRWGLSMGMWPAEGGWGGAYGDTLPARGYASTVDSKGPFDGDAILKESDKYIPPYTGSMNMRGARNKGRSVVWTAMRSKAALLQAEQEGVKLPELRPWKSYPVEPEKGSYLDKLIQEGKLELDSDARTPKWVGYPE